MKPTKVTPYMSYEHSTSILSLSGRSSPENALGFYQSVMDFLDEFANSDQPSLTANVSMEYFNTSSSKCLFSFFKKMNDIQDDLNKSMTVNWYYEDWDDDMLEIGEDFSADLNIEFKLTEVDDLNDLKQEAA